jgi:hypothetical protein
MRLTLAILTVLLVAVPASAVPVFRDGFEPSINHNLWQIGPESWWGVQWHQALEGDDSHIRTPGTNAARAWVNYRVSYNSQRALPQAYDGNIYLKCWIFEDNDIPFPGTGSEEFPNGWITLLDGTDGLDYLSLGVLGTYGKGLPVTPSRAFFYNCSVDTMTDGHFPLDGTVGTRPLTPRRQGWRKFTIQVLPYTGSVGDVKFYIDDKLVFNGTRAAAPPPTGGGAPLDKIILGAKVWWTKETYWYDHVDFGTIDTPQPCSTIAEVKDLPDGTWVQLDHKVVTGRFTKSPFPGYFAVEENDRSAGLWVSSSYEANVAAATHEAEDVSIKGIVYTNEAGMKYLDAMEVTRFQTLAPQPRILGTTLRGLDTPSMDGMLVKVWGKVINVPGSNPASPKGQERRGDWRRFFMIEDGSPGGPVKIYYDNIISGTDPVPDVATGDFVSVVGVYGKEVLVPGTTGSERSIWIRKAGDLIKVRPAQ